MVFKSTEVSLCVRIKTLVEKLCNNLTLHAERTGRNVHKLVESLEEIFFIFSEVCDSGHIDCNNPHRTGAFTATEEATGLLSQLTEVKTKSAAHTAYIAGFHIAVDVV